MQLVSKFVEVFKNIHLIQNSKRNKYFSGCLRNAIDLTIDVEAFNRVLTMLMDKSIACLPY